MTRDEIANINPSAILWDGLDDAIIGMANKDDNDPFIVIDNNGKVVEIEYCDDEDDSGEIYDDRWGRVNFGPVVAYDIDTMIEILMLDMEVEESELEDNQTIEEAKREMASEFFYYNIDGGFVGAFTPVHLHKKVIN